MADVTLLIPHHAGRKLLAPLFQSLFAMNIDSEMFQVLLVDNHSKDGSKEWVRKHYPQVRILELKENLGFAPAMNRGVSACETDWVCFLNNDVKVQADWLTELLGSVNRYPAACYASHITNWAGTQTLFADASINWFGKGFEYTTPQADHPYEIFFASGCGLLVRREVFWEVGGFDDEFFMLFEDLDFGWRLRLMGYNTVFVPSARIRHKAHESLKAVSYRQKALYYERNSLAALYKNLGADMLSGILPLALQEIQWRAKAISGIEIPVRYSSEGLAVMEAVGNFFNHLTRWRAKRRWVQNRRRVEDKALIERFFKEPNRIWAYHDEHYRRVYFPQYREAITQCFEDASAFAQGQLGD